MKNKLVSIVLVLIMVLTVIPSIAFANQYDPSVNDNFDGPISTTVTTTTTSVSKPSTNVDVQNSTSTVLTAAVTTTTKQTFTQAGVLDPSNPDSELVDPSNPDAEQKPTQNVDQTTTTTVDPNHSHVYLGKITKKATCLEDGVKTYSCKCGDSYTLPINKKNHNKTKIIRVKSTYFKKGSKTTVCKFCGIQLKKVTFKKKVVNKSAFKLVKGKKQFKIKYKRVGKSIGFQVRYRIKGKWIKKTFNTKKNATKTIKKLKKGTYKVQIRVFRKLNSKKVYSRWTVTKKVKVLKK